MRIINLRRLALAAPLLIAAGVLLYAITQRGGTGDTPRASLLDTPPGVTDDIGVQTGDLARDFTAQAPDGAVLRLSDLRGRPTMINFWATWCTSCLAELPDFKQTQQEIGPENLNVVAINVGESSSDAREFLDELDASDFRIGMDPTLVIADAYGVYGLPTTVFLDADGVVRAIYAGHLRNDDLLAFIDAASTGDTAAEPDPQLRLVTTVARDHVLEVRDAGDGRVDLRSKSLRCDDSYCASPAINEVEAGDGIVRIERRLGEDPPRIIIAYEDGEIGREDVAQRVGDALDRLGDPLYERELQIVER